MSDKEAMRPSEAIRISRSVVNASAPPSRVADNRMTFATGTRTSFVWCSSSTRRTSASLAIHNDEGCAPSAIIHNNSATTKRMGCRKVAIAASIAIERVVDDLVENRRINVDPVADIDGAQCIDAGEQR